MKNRTVRFLIVSIVCISLLCVLVFSYMTWRMNKRGADVIGELGTLYMAGMSEQAAAHFGTTIELRLSQVSALTDAVPPGRNQREDSVRALLCSYARTRDFDHLALYDADGNFEMLFGNEMEVLDDSFRDALSRGEEIMALGREKDKEGKDLVLMGIPAEYSMTGGKKSMALVAAFPSGYIGDTLSLTTENAIFYYFIIDRNGNFIIRDDDVKDENYFTRVLEKYHVKGRSSEEYLEEIKTAMASNSNFMGEFTLDGIRRYQYGTSLPSSDWYMLLFLPYGPLDLTIDSLGSYWIFAAVMSCLVILIALIALFAYYFHLSRKHMRELETARSAAERANRAKSEFLSNMSHDIRTPMNGIVGMTAIAEANLDDPEQVRNCLNKISLSSRHLLRLINDILDMSKIESGKLELHMERMSLQEVLAGAVNMIQAQTNAKKQKLGVYVYDVTHEYVLCDSVRFSQILLNLLGNAVKFTPKEGSVSITCYEEPSPEGENYTRLNLLVKDTGIGMTEEFLNRVFDAFAREDNARVQKTEGSGLGMAITKYLVDALGGTIRVTSEPNRGTEFHVVFDLGVAEEAERKELPEWEVLIVSCDELFAKCISDTLRSVGCLAAAAHGVEEAIAMLGGSRLTGKEYRAVLLDDGLPEAEGPGLVRSVREVCGEDTAVVVLAASEWTLSPVRGGTEPDGVIFKPVFPSNLARGLMTACKRELRAADGEEKHVYCFRGKRILLAEDNDLNREIAEELLSEIGIRVDSAENGKVCAEMFAQSPEGGYDAILMDIRMPVMSGYEATEAIRAMPRSDAKTIPIIAMSADAFSDDVDRCLACGMNAHTAKPIDMEELSRLLAQYIGESGAEE